MKKQLNLSIAVYCSSRIVDQQYQYSAAKLGKLLGKNFSHFVFGGGCSGLMGIVSENAYDYGAYVIGVMLKYLADKELPARKIHRYIEVDSMRERKMMMDNLSDVVVVLPGGFGTLEEFIEVLVYNQLYSAKKPLFFFNLNGFFDSLFLFFSELRKQNFIEQGYEHYCYVYSNEEKMIQHISSLWKK